MVTKKDRPAPSTTRSTDSASSSRTTPGKGGKRDVGNALRTIYQQTVDESVPKEMLDLLGKLG